MTINYINTGSSPNKGDGDTLRTAFNKINTNFQFLSTATGAMPSALYNGTWTFALTSTGTVTLNGEPFVSGTKGDTGTQGTVGPTGPQGIQGSTGTQGIQGLKGDTGTQGIQGPIGPQGTGGSIVQQDTAPDASTSTLWYDTVGGRSYVYYDSSWVDASPMPAIDTTQLVNSGYSLSLDSAGVVNLPTFSGSPSIAIVQTASAGISLNVNGTYFNFNQNGTLTLPGDLHGAEIFEPSPNGPISAGHQLNITPASNATDKKFEFAINQNSSGVFQNAALQLPTSENNKQVYLSFPGNDSGDSSSSIVSLWNQNTNLGSGEFNNAFNILANGKDIKLTAEARNGSYSTWTFDSSGNLTFPDGGRVVLHPYGNSYIESVDYGITTSTSSLNIFAGPDQKITLRANFGGTEKFWTFGTDGSLTWPDTSVQTGASISIADLKAIITTCTNFTEFKDVILGL